MSTSVYAVVDPSTGELVQEYPTATDEQIEQAIAAAAKAHREWSRESTVAERAALIRKVAELHTERKDELAKIIQREMGKPLDQSVGEVEFSAAIYEYYADNAEKFLADEPIELRRRRGLGADPAQLGRRAARASCRGTTPTTRWPGSRARTWCWATPSCSSTRRSAPSRLRRCSRSSPTPAIPEGAYVNVYATNEQIADVIADPRVQGVSLTGSGARRRRRRRDRGPQPEEGRARARRLRPVHPAAAPTTWTPTVDAADRRSLREHRAGLQRRQADHRRRGHLRRLPGQVHQEGAARRPTGLAPLSSVAAAERLDEQVSGPSTTARRWSPRESARARTSRPAC